MPDNRSESTTVPVAAESLSVGTERIVTGTVRVVKTVETQDRAIDIPVSQDDVSVERVPVGRWVDEPVPIRQEGDTTIIPVLEEVVVIEKRLKLVEEVHVTKKPVEKRATGTVALRRDNVTVERSSDS